MKRAFVKSISNVVAFSGAIERLLNRGDGVPGMALIYGDPGYGKTKTALWWAAQNNAAFVRAIKLMTGRWLLEAIVAELGAAPHWRTSDLFRQAQDLLLENRKTVIVDEVDYLTRDARVIETLRDLHDTTGAPIVFIGMDRADLKLRNYSHLYSRFSEKVKFNPLSFDDIRNVARELCDAEIDDSGIGWIAERAAGSFRRVIIHLYLAEKLARINRLKTITRAEFEKVKR